MTVPIADPPVSLTAPTAPASAPETAAPVAAAQPIAAESLHEDPAIAKALEGLSPEQRESLLTTGGKNALAARAQEAKDAKAQASAAASRAASAADAARQELTQSIGKALGLIKDDEALDPAKLAEQVTVAETQRRETQVELAVYKAASAVGAKADALLDSRAFLAKIAALDPNDVSGIGEAITEAVTSNPLFGSTPAALAVEPEPVLGIPKPNPAQGSSGSGAPSLDDQIAIAKQDNNWRLAMHLENQKLLPQSR